MSATIKEGDHLPDAIFMSPTKDGLKPLSTKEVFGGKKVILVAVPGTLLQQNRQELILSIGAFTPTCTTKHLPGFVSKADELRAKGIDSIACTAVNDAFVLDAWGKSLGVVSYFIKIGSKNVF